MQTISKSLSQNPLGGVQQPRPSEQSNGLATCSKPRTSIVVSLLLLLLIGSAGCQQRTSTKLSGRWEGQPDTAALRAVREAKKYGDTLIAETGDETEGAGNKGSSTKKKPSAKINAGARVTDWEAYDVTVLLDFVSSERIKMSLDGKQPRSGKWKIIATSPTGCTIEVQTETQAKSDAKSDAKSKIEPKIELRRFDLLLDERDGTCVGFTLNEVGADQQLGMLYFQRPVSSDLSE